MKKIIPFVSVIIFCLAADAFGQANDRLQISQRGLFTIVVPGSDSSTNALDDSSSLGAKMMATAGQTTYQVSYQCLCTESNTLNRAKEQLLPKDQTTWKLVSETGLKLNAIGGAKPQHLTGKEFILENNNAREIHRFYAGDWNLYELVATSPKFASGSKEMNEFFESFKYFGSIEDLVKSAGVQRSKLNRDGYLLIDHEELVKYAKFNRPLEYPTIARQNRIQGTVIIDTIFDETGKVVAANVFCGESSLAAAAMKTALGTTIKPMQLNGKPVRVESLTVFIFAF